MTPDISTTLGGIPLTSVVYNASGPRTGSSAAMSKIAASESGAVLAKSATITSQKGNDLPRTWHDEENNTASLNSEGLPNSGIEYYISPQTIEETMSKSTSSTKPYMVSISGKTLADNLAMLKKISDVMSQPDNRIAAVELNLACPNIVGKPTIGYDYEQLEMVMEAVSSLKLTFPLGVKLPPYFDKPHFEMCAEILNKYKHIISYAASINTIGNALAIDYHAEMPSIRANNGYAGLSGAAVKYTALANVKQMRELLDKSIDVVGVGGISSGRDVFEMILCGAQAVQVGTCHWTEGPGCFDRICNELRTIMKEKGYSSVDEFRGKLKPWSKEGAAISRNARKKAAGGGGKKSGDGGKGGGGDFDMIIIALLVALLAALLADKFEILTL